ncbi:MAG TPA: ATP-binding protein [Candidatus Binatia bacterium]|nr:ATP-binding protein [Candidatus Binatia bacterium]
MKKSKLTLIKSGKAPPPEGGLSPGRAARPFVGRERELSELRAGLADALSGRGRLFLVVGEPGIGKTRLAEELAAEATRRGARVLWGRAWEGGGAPAYWPWTQMLRAYIQDCDGKTLALEMGAGGAHIAQIAPEALATTAGADSLPPASTPLEPEYARFYLFDSITGSSFSS